MAVATLTIDLAAIADNWRALNAKSAANVKTAAVVKADGYGLGATQVSAALAQAGANTFFVAAAEEGIAVRKSVPADAKIYVFSGCCTGDEKTLKDNSLIPLLNSPEQVNNFLETGAEFGIQLDTSMNRLGLEPKEFGALFHKIAVRNPSLIMSHLACADMPDHSQNRQQLQTFRDMTADLMVPQSLAATGGILLGADYHFDLTRPGVGLFGGDPYVDAKPVAQISIPIIQTRDVDIGETVGYAGFWQAKRPSKIATIAAGYADGLIRHMGNHTNKNRVNLYSGVTACPLIGRISMDMMTVDITDLGHIPTTLDLLNTHQTINDLADAGDTIGYEILTSLGARYNRVYIGG